MRKHLASAVLACVVITSGPARTVWAKDAKAAAKDEFQRGLALSKQKRHEEALAAFLHSRELYPTRTNTQNAALMLKLLGRYDQSIALLEQMLQEFPNLTDEQRQAVQRELDELAGEVGTIAITTDEPGASVEIDGQPRGTLPLTAPVRVNPGRHRVGVQRSDGTTAEVFVRVAARQKLRIDPVASAASKASASLKNEAPKKPSPAPATPPQPARRTPARALSWRAFLELALVMEALPPETSTPNAYEFIGPGAMATAGLGARSGNIEIAAFGSRGTYRMRNCEPSGAFQYQKVQCSSQAWAAGAELGYIFDESSLAVELGGRFSYFSLQVERDFEIDPTLTYTESGFAAEALAIPALRLSRHFTLGAVMGADTRAMARAGLRVDGEF